MISIGTCILFWCSDRSSCLSPLWQNQASQMRQVCCRFSHPHEREDKIELLHEKQIVFDFWSSIFPGANNNTATVYVDVQANPNTNFSALA